MRFLVLLLVGSWSLAARAAEPAKEGFERWEQEVAAIEQRDQEQHVKSGGVVFVGSSSIRLWNLKQSFPDLAAINHGFGGSTVADSVHFVDRLVLKLKPKTIVFYAGDNDIAQGKSPESVSDDFQSFVKAVHATLPKTRILYIPIKPSPARWKLFEEQQKTNQLIKELIASDQERLAYVDIVTPMLGDDGLPKTALFQKDMLHLNDAGYELWTKVLKPLLK